MSLRTVAECRNLLRCSAGRELQALIDELSFDTRIGVVSAVDAARRRLAREFDEVQRIESLHRLEDRLRRDGWAIVAGVDEVGRGAIAGPVTAAAVVLGPDARIEGLDDSKRLPRQKREQVAQRVTTAAVAVAVAHVPAHVIDALGIAPATRQAMELAIQRLGAMPDHVVTDGRRAGLSLPETAVVRGDATVASVAAASVVAKVARDRLMTDLSRHYPAWGFDIHRGYGTPEHLHAVAQHGMSVIHRRSFAPCSEMPRLF